ncbi:hypothetical protein KKG45_08545 [bacterium]|nr:hypothetical protein [bacterium]MBU1073283.1 hypothetical protein [bacterium]MBU1676188.1 hypothetical protein [bacterium]
MARIRRFVHIVLSAAALGGAVPCAAFELPNEAVNFKALGHWPNGACYAACALGNTVVTGNGAALEIVYFGDAGDPVLVGRTVLPSEVYAIAVVGHYAYVGVIDYGLVIVDISRPDNPQQLSLHPFPSRVYEIEVRDDFAYLAVGYAGLRILDVSNRALPLEVARYTTENSVLEVDLDGDTAYLSYGAGGLHVLDIGDPRHPQLISATMPWPFITGLSVSGDHLFCALSNAGLGVLDISDPAAPQPVLTVPISGIVWDTVLDGHLLYVTGFSCGFNVFDVLVPTAPVYRGGLLYASSLKTAVGHDMLYVPTSPNGLRAVRITGDGPPIEFGRYDEGGHSMKMDLVDGTAYIAARYDGLRILDVKDPARIRELGHWYTNHARDVKVDGDLAFVAAEQDGLRVLDVSDPSAPVEIGHLYSPYASGVVKRGNTLFLADRVIGMLSIDVSDPTQPEVIGSYQTIGETLLDIAGRDSYLYLAYGHNGLRILRVNNPAAPLFLANLDTDGFSQGVDVQGDLVAVADGATGVRLVHVGNPSSPIELGRYDTKGNAAGLDIQGEHLYVASYPYGLIVLDIKDPTAPAWAGSFDTAGTAQSVVARQDLIYLVDMEDGLWILDHDEATGVDEGAAPRRPLLLAAHPNPFNPTTRFTFMLHAPGRAELAIYTPDGRRVARPHDATLPAGEHALTWQGTADDGRPLPSGVYLARLMSGGVKDLLKITLVR